MPNEATTGFSMLYTVLSGDATLMGYVSGIYRDVAPQGTTADWVIVGHQSGVDILTGIASREMTSHLYRVFAVGPETDYANLVLISNRIDALLHPSGKPLRNSNGTLACYREQLLALSVMVPGAAGATQWLNLGGLYRLWI